MKENLTTLEQYQLSRKIYQLKRKIDRARDLLMGQPYKTVRFADASITSLKIENLSADKITTGILDVGQMILVSDGTDDRIMITRDKILISKEGVDVKTTITEANKKDFVLISGENTHKIMKAGYITAGSYTHGRGKVPFFFAFQVDSTSSPTYFKPTHSAMANNTQIVSIPNPSYLMVFNEGGNP
jgi:hypothetical protein